MTKKKHYITTIADIKYCEENELTIYSDTWEPDFFKFANGVWCMYSGNELKIYNNTFEVSYDELYYYEEESEEKPKITDDDLGKKVKFPDGSIGELKFIVPIDDKNFMYGKDACTFYKSCEIIEEQTEATEKDVGKLCLFKSKTEIHYKVSILKKIVRYNGFNMYETEWGDRFGCCRRLSPVEVAEITGYKVEEAE